MNVKEKILKLNQEHTNKSVEITDVLLTVITKFQLFEPCSYLSEDDEWLNVALISIEDNSVSQALSIKKSEITTLGIFNREEIEISMVDPQMGSEDLYQ
jgi:chorismate mutase